MNPNAFSMSELDDYVAGTLTPDRRRAVEAAAEADPALSTWLSQRVKERQSFLLDPRRRSFAELSKEAKGSKDGHATGRSEWRAGWRFGGPSGWRSRWVGGGLAAALLATAAMALVVLPSSGPGVGKIRTKGGLSIQAAVLKSGASQMFEPGRPLHPGDRMRLTINDPAGGYVTVLLEERSGEVDILYRPEELGKLAPGEHRLPGSLQLDSALGRERLYILVSDALPKVDDWITEIHARRQQRGFEHDWLPPGQTRVGVLEYEKASGP